MRVVADSQALVRYLVDPARLSEPALDALLAAEDSDGVIVLDPATNLVLHPISVATMRHFTVVPLNDLRDPFDRFILATALQLGIPLVSADRAIANTKTAEIIW